MAGILTRLDSLSALDWMLHYNRYVHVESGFALKALKRTRLVIILGSYIAFYHIPKVRIKALSILSSKVCGASY